MKKINIRILFPCCIALLLCILIVFSQSRPRLTPPDPPPTSTTTRSTPVVTTTSDGYDSTFFMNCKNRGDCKAFRGKVLLNFFMVSDGEYLWTEEALEEFKKTAEDAIYFLNYDSDRFGIDLEIICNYTFISWPEKMVREEHRAVIPEMLKSIGFEDKHSVSASFSAQFGTDSAALLFCFNRQERSLCTPVLSENGFEHAVLYGSNEDFRHELLHLYGAKDLYTPERIDKISSRFFSDSIMRVSGGFVVDPLTAFLIGWSENLSDVAKEFLAAVDR